MQAFRDLSSVGKIRRLRSLARDALEKKFGITNASLSLLSTHSFNTIFRVDCEDGQRYALRVGDEIRIHTRGVETIEAEWLDSLGTITPMRSVPTIAGKFGETIENAMVDGQRVVSLLTWVPGSDLRHRFWSDAAAHAGRLLAELHRQSQTPQPATQVRLIRADVPITFGDRTLLGKWRSPHGSLFAEAIHRAQIGLDQLWASPPHRPHLLHGDFAPHNIMRHRNRLMPIDFQDMQFGFDFQDIAIAFTAWQRDYPQAIDDFRIGYTSVRPWPTGANDSSIMALLTAARSLNVLNLGLQLRRFGFEEFMARHTSIITAWMKTDPG